jgi:hypothetical protein
MRFKQFISEAYLDLEPGTKLISTEENFYALSFHGETDGTYVFPGTELTVHSIVPGEMPGYDKILFQKKDSPELFWAYRYYINRDTVLKKDYDKKFLDDLTEATAGTGTPSSVLARAFKEIANSYQSRMPDDPSKPANRKDKLTDFLEIGSVNSSMKSPPNAKKTAYGLEKRKIKSVTIEVSPFKFQEQYDPKTRSFKKPSVKTDDSHRELVKQFQKETIEKWLAKAEESGFHLIGWIDGPGASNLYGFDDIKTFNLDKFLNRSDSNKVTFIFDGEVQAAKGRDEIMSDIMEILHEKLKFGPQYHALARSKPHEHEGFSTNAAKTGLYRHNGDGTGWFKPEKVNPLIIYPPVFNETAQLRNLISQRAPDTRKIDLMLGLYDDDVQDDFANNLRKQKDDLIVNQKEHAKEKIRKFMAIVAKDIAEWNKKMPSIAKKIEAAIQEIAASSPYHIKVEIKPNSVKTTDYVNGQYVDRKTFGASLRTKITGEKRSYISREHHEPLKDFLDMLCIFIYVGERKAGTPDKVKFDQD